jgi:peroxiredoxin Q/BCP
MLKVGESLPEFNLYGVDEQGEEKQYKNTDFLGNLLVLYFYPKDDTPGCTKEACAFNAMLPQILKHCKIIGVSADSTSSHLKFQKKYGLKFPLLSDKDAILAKKMFATKDKLINKILSKGVARSTFLFDKSGVLIRAWYDVSVDGHDTDVLNEINKAM